MIVRDPATLPATADAVVVGAGAVGLVLADALARKGRSVVVVEAGPESLDPGYAVRNDAVSTGRFHAGLATGRYKGLGGTTRLWGGQLARMSDADFAGNARAGKPAWPIDVAKLRQLETELFVRLGLPLSPAEADAAWRAQAGETGLPPQFRLEPAVWLRQPDLTRTFAAGIAASDGPIIVPDREVTGLIADEADGRIGGVILAGGARIAARDTILANGTIEISALLLRTCAAMPNAALAANRHVGRWFMDHLHGLAGTMRPHDADRASRLFDTFYGRAKLSPKLRLSDAYLREAGIGNCAVTISGTMGPGAVLREIVGLGDRIAGQGGAMSRLAGARLVLPLAWQFLRKRRSNVFLGRCAAVGIEIEQLPCADSRITLERDVPAERARPMLHWQLGGRELEAARDLARRFDAFCRGSDLGEIAWDPRLERLDTAMLDDYHEANHHIGGARMALSSDDGVVDGNGAVFGMPGLHVAGAATFPSGSFANPTCTAMALALGMAERLGGGRS